MFRNTLLFKLFLFILIGAISCGEEPPPRGVGSSNAGENEYVCTSVQTDEDFCEEAGFECGTHFFEDECQATREVNCGDETQVCGEFESCGGAGQEGLCGCTPGADEELCEEAGYECGTHELIDGCGEPREVNCGDALAVCGEFETCGDVAPGRCSCTPELDEELCQNAGFECGTHDFTDACGEVRQVDCGEEANICSGLETCGGGGEEGLCGCTAETDQQLCDGAAFECGPLTTIDSCGVERTIESCGDEAAVCGQFETCGGGGTEGRCGCSPESDTILCLEAGYECGPLHTTDSCGIDREIQSCGQETEVCGLYQTCGGGGQTGVCGCTPTSCEAEGVLCGEIFDGCGSTLYCDTFCSEQIAVGDEHGCAVGAGRIKCWGRNNQGQIGDGTNVATRSNPVDVTDLQNAIDVAAGTSHTCAIVFNPNEQQNQVRCWGLNQDGQLGNGETVNSRVPVTTPAIYYGAAKIALGERHSCAIRQENLDYEVRDADNIVSTRPLNTMHCWGSNSFGQIGDPSLELGSKVALPRAVDLGPDYSVLDIAIGANHSCALLEGPINYTEPNDEEDLNKVVQCWGRNRMGQISPLQPNYPANSGAPAFGVNLDIINSIDAATLKRQPTLLNYPGPNSPRWITAGEDHTCVVDQNGQDVYCWGSFHAPPRAGTTCSVGFLMNYEPRRDEDPPYRLQSQNASVCPILPSGSSPGSIPVFTYTTTNEGKDHNMQAGIISAVPTEPSHFRIDASAFPPMPPVLNLQTLDVVSGSNHFCAIVDHANLNSSNILCLGANRSGQLGEGTDSSWTTLQEVSRDIHDQVVISLQLSLGKNVSCGLMDDNNVRCWGSNQYGQIGNSDLLQDESFRPFDVRLQVAP